MILASAVKAFYETSEFWTAVQAVAALASVGAAFFAVRAANKAHKESGPIISVTMSPFLYAPKRSGSSMRTELSGNYGVKRIGAPQIELALITVANTGRTAATVKGVYLKIEGIGENPNFRQTAREMPGGDIVRTVSFEQGPVVIEPYSEKNVLLDFWGRMDSTFTENPSANEIVVTGVADVVGLEKPVESQKHGQWVVSRNHRSFSGNHTKVRPIDVMATQIAWKFRDLLVAESLEEQLTIAEIQLQPEYDFMELSKNLEPMEHNKVGRLKEDGSAFKITQSTLQMQKKIEALESAGYLLRPPSKDGKVPGEK